MHKQATNYLKSQNYSLRIGTYVNYFWLTNAHQHTNDGCRNNNYALLISATI